MTTDRMIVIEPSRPTRNSPRPGSVRPVVANQVDPRALQRPIRVDVGARVVQPIPDSGPGFALAAGDANRLVPSRRACTAALSGRRRRSVRSGSRSTRSDRLARRAHADGQAMGAASNSIQKVTKPGPTWTTGTNGVAMGVGIGVGSPGVGSADGRALGDCWAAGLGVGPTRRVGVGPGGRLTSTAAPASTVTARTTMPMPSTRPMKPPCAAFLPDGRAVDRR